MTTSQGAIVLLVGALIVVLVVLFMILAQVRRLGSSGGLTARIAPQSPDLNGFDQVIAELKVMVSEGKRDDKLRQTNLDVANVLGTQDRLQLARLVTLMGLLDTKVSEAAIHAESVADDLAASHDRANQTDGPSGAAADAAFKNT